MFADQRLDSLTMGPERGEWTVEEKGVVKAEGFVDRKGNSKSRQESPLYTGTHESILGLPLHRRLATEEVGCKKIMPSYYKVVFFCFQDR